MQRIISFGLATLILTLPFVASAAINFGGNFKIKFGGSGMPQEAVPYTGNPTIDLLLRIASWAQMALAILGVFAIAGLFFGLAKYLWSDVESDKDKAKGIIVWGMIGLFVMVSLWAILGFFQQTFGVSGQL